MSQALFHGKLAAVSGTEVLSFVKLGLATGLVYYLGILVYNVFFHPLRSYPGPLLWRASRLPYCLRNVRGTLAFDVLAMFERYGPVVRVAPNELAYVDAAAWREIAGHNPRGDENGKWTDFYRPAEGMPTDLISADRELHGRLRRQLAHGFSDRSMREQEPLIRSYVDLLIKRLGEHCKGGAEEIDMCKWFNFTTFDIIGDLAFGEPFGCLQTSSWHSWVQTLFKLTELGVYMQSAIHYPSIKNLLLKCVPKHYMDIHAEHEAFTHERISKRVELGKQRNDLIEGLLMKQDELQLPQKDVESHAGLLIVAGSETTATLLSGATYLLLKNPETLARLTHEVRSTFKSDEEINISSAAQLTYMIACLDESLRMYPPVPIGLPRIVAQGGRTLCGKYVPEGTHVAVWQWAAYHYSGNFVEPFEYRPERSLESENEKFAEDKRDVLQPFSFGPRNCIGKNLAYAEMRTIMARLIFNFDLKLAPESSDWMSRQKVFNLWAKPPLGVYLTPRK